MVLRRTTPVVQPDDKNKCSAIDCNQLSLLGLATIERPDEIIVVPLETAAR